MEMGDKVIQRVRENKYSGQKFVTIPKEDKEIKRGDYVEIKKIE